MPRFTVDGLAGLIADFDELALMPEGTLDGMLNAEADVVANAQKQTARSMLGDKGTIANAITKKKPKRVGGVRVLYITFDGIAYGPRRPKAGNRIAEIAFVNEFGKTSQPARPFIMTANEKSADEAVGKAAKVYDDYLRSRNL